MKRWIKQLRQLKVQPAHLRTGRWGERQAERFLKSRRYKIIGRRVRVGRHDELDIIAVSGAVLVFVEVKTRRSEKYGRPFAAVNREKRKRISRAAVTYLKKQNTKPDYIRFDVIEVIGEPGKPSPELRHIENAFELDAAYRLWW